MSRYCRSDTGVCIPSIAVWIDPPAPVEAAMCSVQHLREFIKERLTAVCEEIFLEVQKTIVQYEEEISRQRRLLDISRKPDTNSLIIDLPQLHDCEEEEGLDEHQVCNQERHSSLDQVNPEPPQIKEEQEELCSSQEGEQLGLKLEANSIWTDEEQQRMLETIWKPEIRLHRIDLQRQHVCEDEVLTEQQVCNQEGNSSVDQEDPEPPQIKEEQEELCSSQEGEQLGLKQEADAFMVNPTYEESDHSEAEPNSELLSHSPPETERQDQEESQHVDSGSTRNAKLKKRKSHSQRVDDAPVSESQSQIIITKRSLRQKSHLTRHLTIHTGEKRHHCSTCWKGFSQKTDLEHHIRIHTDENLYPCDACGKRFSDASVFIKHVCTHTVEKPYLCSTCGKRFNQKLAWVYHIESHTGQKQYRCRTCGKKFSRMGNLKKHTTIHAG